MAIIRTDLETGEILQMTDREIKAEVQNITGWTTSQYQKEYDKFRNRLRNYEATIGAKTPKRPNEEFLRILRKQSSGRELTAEQNAYLKQTSAGTRIYNSQVAAGKVSRTQTRIANAALLGVKQFEQRILTDADIMSFTGGKFSNMVQASPTIKNELKNWLNEVVSTETIKVKGETLTKPIYRYETAQPKDINDFLSKQAKDLHRWQKNTYNSNKSYYGGGGGGLRRRVGSDY